MKTFLQSINDIAAQYVTMPLQRFFLYVTVGLWVTLMAIALFTPLSLSKFTALIGLYATSIITALLTYANYQMSRIEQVEAIGETPKDDNRSERIPSPKLDSEFVA